MHHRSTCARIVHVNQSFSTSVTRHILYAKPREKSDQFIIPGQHLIITDLQIHKRK